MSKKAHRKIPGKDQHVFDTKFNPKDTISSNENLKAIPSSNSLNEESGENAVPGWTPDEKSTVCKFYKIETLTPDSWSDDEDSGPSDAPPNAASKKVRSSIRSSIIASPSRSPAKPSITISDDSSDILDPFGLNDVIFREKRKRIEKEIKTGKSILITSKAFNPTTLLTQAHKDTSFAALQEGMKYLKISIEQRNEMLKQLVKTNFGKFVSAKTTIDSFYDEMKTENLISSETQGIASFTRSLGAAYESAKTFYHPMLERRVQANRIRTVINILDTWRFFFSLPSTLADAIKKKKFDIIVRDFNKGKYIVETSLNSPPAQNSHINTADIDAPLYIPDSHRKVFEKVWVNVQLIIGGFRKYLFRKLQDSYSPVEKQEKIIAILVRLNPECDPGWFYITHQYKFILQSIMFHYEEFISKVSCYSEQIFSDPLSLKWTAIDLKKLFNCLGKDTIEGFDSRLDIFVWKSVQILIKAVSDILIGNLPGFWKVCRSFYTVEEETIIDFQSAETHDKKTYEDVQRLDSCSAMLENIFHTYGAIVINLFHVEMDNEVKPTIQKHLSLVAKDPRSRRFSKNKLPFGLPGLQEEENALIERHYIENSTLPPLTESERPINPFIVDDRPTLSVSPSSVLDCLNTHPVIRLWFMSRIMLVMANFLYEIRERNVGGSHAERFINPTVEKLNSLKDKILHDITESIVEESKELYRYESWALTRLDENEKISMIIEIAYRFYKFSLRNLHRIALTYFGDARKKESSNTDKRSSKRLDHTTHSQISLEIQDQIRYSFIDSMHFLLDGMEWLIVNWKGHDSSSKGLFEKESLELENIKKQFAGTNFNVVVGAGDNAQSVIGWGAAARSRAKQVDESYLDTRALIVIGNLRFMVSTMIPKICDIFQKKFKLSIESDSESLKHVISHLDAVAFQNYVRRKFILVHRLLRNGILMSGIDWNSMVEVQEVRPYCHEILLLLVTVHAHVSDICKPSVHRILKEILHRTAEDILLSFRKIDQFNAFGMTQALLEVQFLQDTLFAFSSDQIHELFLLTYEMLEKSLDPEDPFYVAYKERETGASKRFITRIMDSETFRELIEEKDALLESAKSCTKVQLMCFCEDAIAKSGSDDLEDSD